MAADVAAELVAAPLDLDVLPAAVELVARRRRQPRELGEELQPVGGDLCGAG